MLRAKLKSKLRRCADTKKTRVKLFQAKYLTLSMSSETFRCRRIFGSHVWQPYLWNSDRNLVVPRVGIQFNVTRAISDLLKSVLQHILFKNTNAIFLSSSLLDNTSSFIILKCQRPLKYKTPMWCLWPYIGVDKKSCNEEKGTFIPE